MKITGNFMNLWQNLVGKDCKSAKIMGQNKHSGIIKLLAS